MEVEPLHLDCARTTRLPECRFHGYGDTTDMLPIGEAEARNRCCRACALLDECTGFSFETTHTTIRATNRTLRATYNYIYMRRHEELLRMAHKRELYEAVGHARATRTESACYVPPPPSPNPPPEPPNPPPDPPGSPSPVALLSNVEIKREVAAKPLWPDANREAPMGDQEAEDWWWLLPDMEDDHWDPWMNRTPVPKVRWYPTSDAFDRL